MTTFELLYLITTVLLLIVSTASLIRQRRIEQEQARQRRVQEELAAKQLEMLRRQEREQDEASLVAEMVKEGPGRFAFLIVNRSRLPAHDVTFEMLDCAESPLHKPDFARKIPAESIAPGCYLRLVLAWHMELPLSYRARVSWRNPDGTRTSQDFSLVV